MGDHLALRPPREEDLAIIEKLNAGFTAEGVARAIGWRDGQWRDGVTYSLLRTDPAAHPAPDAAP